VRAALALMLALIAGPVVAQDVGAMQMQARTMAGKEPDGDPPQTHEFSICVARKHRATALLEMLPYTNDESDYVFGQTRYGEINCGPENRKLLVGARFIRGGAAEYLLERSDFDEDIFDMPNNAEFAKLGPDTRSAIVFIQIGECAAKANPAGVTALLAAGVRTPEEKAAFDAVMPAVGGCIPEGLDFRIGRLLLRSYLAEGAYRNAVAGRALAQGATP
jgi:hypothetical protein